MIRPANSRTPTYGIDNPTTKDTKSTKMEFEDLSNRLIGCAIEVYRHLGPGLFESAYEQCLAHELCRNRIAFQRLHPLPVVGGYEVQALARVLCALCG